MWGLHFCWIMTCVLLIAEPPQVKRLNMVRANRIVPAVMMLGIIVGMSYIQSPLEQGGIRACSALVFTLLAFAWIYVVGIYTPHGIEYLKESSCQFVSRLAPVLYSPLWLAAVFAPAVIGALVLYHTSLPGSSVIPLQNHLSSTSHTSQQHQPQVQIQSECHSVSVKSACSEIQNDQDNLSDVQELFRLAKMSRGKQHLDSVPE